MRRVVITGLGIVSPLGCQVREFWTNLTAGQSGIDTISLFDASSFPVRIGGEVKGFDPRTVLERFAVRRPFRDRKVPLGLAAAEQAIRDSGLDESDLEEAMLTLGVGLEALWLEDLTPHASAPIWAARWPGTNGRRVAIASCKHRSI